MEILQQFTVGSFVLIGLVNIVQMAFDRKWDSFVKALCAVIAGGIFGYLKFYGFPSIEVGIALGIGSSGVYKISQVIGVKTQGQPNI